MRVDSFGDLSGRAFRPKITDLPERRVSGWHTYPEKTIPKLFIITSSQRCDSGKTAFVNFYSEERKDHAYLPMDLDLEEVVGKEKIDLQLKVLKGALYHSFTSGSDPEVFVENERGIVIPAFSFLPDKKNPVICGAGNTAYWDGFQAEFTTIAGYCLDGQRNNIAGAMETILRKARELDPNAKLSSKTVMDIPHELLEKGLEEHVQFGCMPSLNAYGLEGLRQDGRAVPFRPAGGHMHFGIKGLEKGDYVRIVKALDAVVGVACVSLFAQFDDPRRRSLYGLPGEYRLPPHGLEYRTLSNAWLFHPLITNIVWDLARKVVMAGKTGLIDHLWVHDEKETIRIITECDVEAARSVLRKNKANMIKLLDAAHYAHPEAAYRVFRRGAECAVENFTDIEANWGFDGKGKSNHMLQWRSVADTIAKRKKVA